MSSILPPARPVRKRPIVAPHKILDIYHPGYLPDQVSLFRLFPFPIDPDGDLTKGESYGFPAYLVLAACSILANNEVGELYFYPSGEKVSEDQRMLLPTEYTFQLNGRPSTHRYSVCRSFYHWTPPAEIPAHWLFDRRDSEEHDIGLIAPSAVTQAVRMKDQTCIMSLDEDRLDSSHIVPASAAFWFSHFGLYRKAGDKTNPSVNSPNNLVLLRSDLNGCGSDSANFCIVPYDGSWITLWMGPNSGSLAYDYNYRSVALPLRIRGVYLYTRFAWNVITLARRFCPEPQLSLIDLGIDLRSVQYADEDDEHGEDEDDEDNKDNDNDGGDDGDNGGDGDDGTGGRSRGGDKDGHRGGKGHKGGKPRTPRRPGQHKMTPRSASQHKAKKRQASGKLEPLAKKKQKNTENIDNIPDLSCVDDSYIAEMKTFDQRLQTDPEFQKLSSRYPGFSKALELEHIYRREHPAATDPGGARIALVSERTNHGLV
ncbi:hypothetical protein C8R45DRAFT_1214037 [Mycena sanguinolenta]|nr:hypothetical protein C8R45DRAFT_1214037 [Mycena sanguinolenta]